MLTSTKVAGGLPSDVSMIHDGSSGLIVMITRDHQSFPIEADIMRVDQFIRQVILPMTVLICGCLANTSDAQSPEYDTSTYTYKRVGGLAIQADVLRADDDVVRPVVVWIHGGALILGHREQIDRHVRERLLNDGYVIVSIDYRLAPETRLPEIIEDVEDALAWIRRDGPELFHIAPNRLAVMGGSAGGYLTLMTGYRVHPRPTALVAFWGYGELLGHWYNKPSPHPRHNSRKISKVEADAQAGGPVISDARQRSGDGGIFYNYCRQQGQWPFRVSGWDPDADAALYTPYLPVKNVTAEYPPTLLIHGEEDTDVPHEQSVLMAEQFKQHGVEHRLISLPGGEHGLGGADPKLIDEAYEAAFQFLEHHMQK